MSLESVQKYLEETLGIETAHFPVKAPIPFFIQDHLQIVEFMVGFSHEMASIVLLIDKQDAYPGIVKLRKMLEAVTQSVTSPLVYVSAALDKTERRALISNRINFIQPGFQMFLPILGVELREHFKHRKPLRSGRAASNLNPFYPATQATLLERLYQGWLPGETFTSSQLMGDQQYSRVTLGKVIEQLKSAGIVAEAQANSGVKSWRFTGTPGEIFNLAAECLRSPVKKVVGINTIPPEGVGLFLAGESALSQLSMIAEPKLPVYCLVKPIFDLYVQLHGLEVEQDVDRIVAYVEIWNYTPLSLGPIPDEASLYLSLREQVDERVQLALMEMVGRVKWLEDGADF